MYICRPALILSFALTILGTLLAGFGGWGVGAYYGIVMVSVAAYFALLSWIEIRESRER
jgi:hypothetical protein